MSTEAPARGWSRRSLLALGCLALGARRAPASELAASRVFASEEGCLDGLLDRRRMIRRFRPDPIDDAVVRRLIDAATRAPSAGHTEPWSFVVVRDAGMRRDLARAALAQMFVAEAPVVVVPCADLSRSRRRYRARGDRYGLIDTSFASMLLLLAVTEEGLGACFVGAFDDAEVKRLLGLPDDVQPLAVVPIGVPAEEPRDLERRPLGDVLRSESWGGA